MKLYEINSQIEDAISNIMASVDETTGEVSQEAVDKLTELQIQRDEKLDNIGAYMKNLASDIDALKTEEKALASRRKVKENELENLKKYVSLHLNGEKFESARVRFSFRRSEAVKITDVTIIPKKYLIKEITWKPDTSAIKDMLKAGKKVKGAFLDERSNLQIK